MTRHPETLAPKAKTHDVTRLSANTFQVISGHSGETYTVQSAALGYTCTCNFASKRRNVVSCGCSHTIAVAAFVEAEKARTVKVHANPADAARTHRQQIQLGDGLIVTTRKSA